MIKDKPRICVICGNPLTGDDAYGGSITHIGECRITRARQTKRSAKAEWRKRNPLYRTNNPIVRRSHCIVCKKPIVGRSIRAVTCSEECGETRRRNVNNAARRAVSVANGTARKPRPPKPLPGAPLEPRKTRMNQSAVINTWNTLHSMVYYQRPETIAVIKTNKRGVVAELIDCPDDVTPCNVTLHCCGAGCWKIRINGKPITDAQRNRWAHEHQSFSYRIRERVTS